jgi:hypothetical protein
VRFTLKVIMQTDRDFADVIVPYSYDCHKCNNFQLKFLWPSINAAKIAGHFKFILEIKKGRSAPTLMYHKLRSGLQIFLLVVIKNQEPIEMH